MSKKIKFCLYIILIVLLFFICQLTLKGIGAGSSEANAFLFTSLILILSFSKRTFWFIAFPIFLIQVAYIPIGLVFGLPSYQSIASIRSTNILETKEFLSQISIYNFSYMLLLLVAFILFRFIYVKYKFSMDYNKIIIVLFTLFSFFNQGSGVFFKESYFSLKKISDIDKDIHSYTNEWGNVSINDHKNRYNTYVLVIGESARMDYINAFGYPLNNSPFMSGQGLIVKGLISGGSNTVASLSNMLTKNDQGQANFNKNIIDLANSAGLTTYWLSNQGFISDADTPISLIATKSQYKDFIKYGAFNSQNSSDFELVDRFKQIVNKNTDQPKLIIVHLYGSHPKPCARVNDYPEQFRANKKEQKQIACYVNSIKKTDDVLKEINSILDDDFKRNHASYSMVYFADHGLVHNDSKKEIQLVHGESINSYRVPLFTISSDDIDHRQCDSMKSGLHFIDGLATWLAIKNDYLDPRYDLFDCKNDPAAQSYLDSLRPKFKSDNTAINIAL
ncbi:phosphoethanolamine transferase [Moellerella wisconsensis]|uniref:phosphoethanolamine transferase n=1 Tax=Moellerella wisconsensis TaxID=158849 RepID=UPI003075F5BC